MSKNYEGVFYEKNQNLDCGGRRHNSVGWFDTDSL
jgi:hypothetical protein